MGGGGATGADGVASLRGSLEIDALLDELPDLIMIHRDGVLLWVNRAVVTTLEYEDASAIVGRPISDIVPAAYQDLLRRRLAALTRGEELGMQPEAAVLTRTGRVVMTELGKPLVVSFGGSPARLLVGRDITERLRLQQRLMTADRMAALGMLAAGVAHEVNNPLGYILNNIELATRDLKTLGDASARSRAALAVALEGVDRIRSIVRQLLLLARSDESIAEVVEVRGIVESTLALARGDIDRHARLECRYEPVPAARGTEARLGQVLLNLVVNALEAMKSGAPEDNRLGITVRAGAAGAVLVEVSDNGPGISADHAPRVFDPFFTTKPQGEGTGLGLSISQGLLAEIGGDLTFEPTPGGGTTFRIALPGAASATVALVTP